MKNQLNSYNELEMEGHTFKDEIGVNQNKLERLLFI
jgi:hypothetical protein